MGKVVNFEKIFDGSTDINVEAPITTIGAVSPIALETAKIVPVKILSMEEGSTCDQIVCHFVAPIPYPACLSD